MLDAVHPTKRQRVDENEGRGIRAQRRRVQVEQAIFGIKVVYRHVFTPRAHRFGKKLAADDREARVKVLRN